MIIIKNLLARYLLVFVILIPASGQAALDKPGVYAPESAESTVAERMGNKNLLTPYLDLGLFLQKNIHESLMNNNDFIKLQDIARRLWEHQTELGR